MLKLKVVEILTLVVTVTWISALMPSAAVSKFTTASERTGKLIRGIKAKSQEFPWIISLQRGSIKDGPLTHFCGSGAILNEWTIVTAAHCVHDKVPPDIKILAGSLNSGLHTATAHAQLSNVREIFIHPNYTTGGKPGSNDLALLTLDVPLRFGKNVQPIKIPDPAVPYTKFSCCVTMGWGNTFPIALVNFRREASLQKVKTQVISNFYCKIAYPLLIGQLTNTICTTSGPFKGPCNGDSGNPLICYLDKVPYLLGLGSWGWVICGDGFHPDVYTDIKILSDILNHTQKTGVAK